MSRATVTIASKVKPVLTKPLGTYRYRCLYGGRGSGKSFQAALMALIFGYQKPLRILCAREFQVSIRESFHAELRLAIEKHDWLANHYEVTNEYIRGKNGTSFFFKGLKNNVNTIKSLAGIDLTIIEEAEDIPEQSWLALEATVFRREASELWVIWNPRKDSSPVDKRFIKYQPMSAATVKVNWNDNPFFPGPLNDLRLRDKEILDKATYDWIWEGMYLRRSEAQVLADKYEVKSFTPKESWDRYFGIDFGYSSSPTAFVEVYTHGDSLYIYRELYKRKLELDDTAREVLLMCPDANKYPIRGDSARPESISYLKRSGLPRIMAASKWQGSVEDGIAYLRNFKRIIVHPSCTNMQFELDSYAYKVDTKTGDVLPQVIDAYNHLIDATRYALQPLIKSKGYNWRGMTMS